MTGYKLLAQCLGLALASATAAAAEALDPPVLAVSQAPRLQQTLEALADDRVVFVGETHTRFDHHLVQLEVLKYLHRRHGDVAIGAEWFQFPAQRHLDDYLAGAITEAQMLERTGYFDRWRFDYRLYRPIIRYARDNGIPIVALNAPVELTRKIGEVGLSGLSAEERARLPADYMPAGKDYVARMREAFDAHPLGDRRFEDFLDVMLTWDETMAARAAEHLHAHPGRRMVVFAGRGHVMYGDGIPDRFERRSGIRGTRLLIGAEQAGIDGVADYLVLSQERSLPPAGLLGAFLDGGEGGVRVAALGEDSALGRAGLRADDLLLSIDDVPTPSFSSIKLALLDRAPGDKLTVRYRRDKLLGAPVEGFAVVTLGGESLAGHP